MAGITKMMMMMMMTMIMMAKKKEKSPVKAAESFDSKKKALTRWNLVRVEGLEFNRLVL